MAGKRTETSFDQRQLVIYHTSMGKSYREVAQLLNMCKSTVGDIAKRFKEDRIDSKERSGRPKILNDHDERWIMRKVATDPRISAPKLSVEVAEACEKRVSAQTIRRTIHSHGFNGRIARKKPFISEVNRKKRIVFAKEHQHHEDSYWNSVLFSDESKFNIFGSDGRVKVWRKPNTALNPKHLRPTVKHGGGSVMVWGCFSAAGPGKLVFIDGVMDKMSYLQILKDNLKASADLLGITDSFQFYQDNDPKHTAYVVRE